MVLGGAELWLEDAPPPPERIRVTPRVNVHYAGAWASRRWRFLLDGNKWVSGGRGRRASAPSPSSRERAGVRELPEPPAAPRGAARPAVRELRICEERLAVPRGLR
jgi:DNA-3-methyladenine glycosylase